MKNIEYLISTLNIPNYTASEMNDILVEYCELNQHYKLFSVCMEEFAELIEVITDNNIRGKVDYTHLREEIVDCYLCLEFLKIIYSINDSHCLKFSKANRYSERNLLNNCILNLSTAITKVSKCVREKEGSHLKVISVINSVGESLYNLRCYYSLKDKTIDKITQLKIKRFDDRIKKIKEDMLKQAIDNTQKTTEEK